MQESIMKAEIKKKIEITIILTEAEADWLKGIVQNPLSTSESDDDYKMRAVFFTALKEVSN